MVTKSVIAIIFMWWAVVGAAPSPRIAQLGDGTIITEKDIVLWSSLMGFPPKESDIAWKQKAAEYIALGYAAKKQLSKDQVDDILEIKPYIQRHYAAQLLQEQLIEESHPTEKEIRAAYDQFTAGYEPETKILFDHIFLDTHRLTDPKEMQDVEKKAESILKRLRAGEPFSDLAKEFSNAKSASEGGRSGPFPLGKLSAQIESHVLALRDSETGDVLKGKYGFHIIRRVSVTQDTVPSFEEKHQSLRKKLAREQAQNTLSALAQSNNTSSFKPSDTLLKIIMTTLPWDIQTSAFPYTEQNQDEFVDLLRREKTFENEIERRNLYQSQYTQKRVELWIGREAYNRYSLGRLPEISVTEEEIERYIKQHHDELRSPEHYHLAIIKVFDKPKDSSSPAQKHLAREATNDRLNEALKRLRNGEDFASVAQSISEDESAENGGDIGIAPINMRGHVITEARQNLKDGEISGIVRGADYGLIVRQIATIPPQSLAPDQARAESEKRIRLEKQQKAGQEMRDHLLESVGFKLVAE